MLTFLLALSFTSAASITPDETVCVLIPSWKEKLLTLRSRAALAKKLPS